MLAIRQLLIPALVTAALATGCLTSYSSEGFLTDVLVLTDLNPKVLPIAVEADADPKDTVYKPKARFKPDTSSVFGSKDVRLLLRGKKDGAAVRAILEREFFATGYELHVRIAFDPNKTTGLVDGTSLGFFELVLDTAVEGSPPLRRLEAVYNELFNGFTLRATDGSAPLGTTVSFGNAPDVVLQFRLEAGTLFLEGGAANGPFENSFLATPIHSEVLAVEGVTRQTVAWGAMGLGKKGTLYVNHLTLGGILPDIGAAETPIAMMMSEAFNAGINAAFNLQDLAGTVAAIEQERQLLADITAALGTALEQGSLDPVTEGERALKNAEKALKDATKGKAVGDKLLAKGSDKLKPVQKKALQSVLKLQLSLGQLAGFRSNSKKRLVRSGYLPFGF